MSKPFKIILASGASGGHIFPAVSLAEELLARIPQAQIIYISGQKDIENEIFKVVKNAHVVTIKSAPYQGIKSFVHPSFLIKLHQGFWKIFNLIRKEKADLVIGFGGYVSFPAVLAARFCGTPCVIHEQNVIPGTANKFLSRIADAVAISFKETTQYLGSHKKIVLTGNPIRVSIERDCRAEAMSEFGLDENKKTLLVLGGSQGAESINLLFLGALKYLPQSFKERIQVIHLCGKMKPMDAEKEYKKEGIYCRVFSFFDRMDLVYAVTDFSLGRAGATFLAEIAVKRIPAILVPFPFAKGHQLLNAQAFCQDHRAIIVEQKNLTSEKLASLLQDEFVKLNQINSKETPIANSRLNAREVFADFVQSAYLVKN